MTDVSDILVKLKAKYEEQVVILAERSSAIDARKLASDEFEALVKAESDLMKQIIKNSDDPNAIQPFTLTDLLTQLQRARYNLNEKKKVCIDLRSAEANAHKREVKVGEELWTLNKQLRAALLEPDPVPVANP